MLKLAIVLFVISIIAGALGFTGVARGLAGLAKVIFFTFLALAALVLVLMFMGVALIA